MNNNESVLNILDAMVSSDYPSSNKDYIISIMYDVFLGISSATIFLMNRYNKKSNGYENILAIRYKITITFNGRNYDVPILIYLPKVFPTESPEIYIEKTDDIGINPKNLQIQNFRVLTPSIQSWNMSTSNLASVINDIAVSFSNIFPVYKLDIRERGKVQYPSECSLPLIGIQMVDFDAPSKQDKPMNNTVVLNTNNNVSSNLTNTYSNNNYNNSMPPQKKYNLEQIIKVDPIKNYTDDQIKKILINELITKLDPKVKAEHLSLKRHEEELLKYKNSYIVQMDKVKILVEKKDDIIKTFNSLTAGLQDQIAVFKEFIEQNSKNKDSYDNIDDLIVISDPKLVKIIAIEAVLEDFLFVIRKAFERKVFNFTENIRMIRNITRELYQVKYYRDKLAKNK